ncbi:MAG: C13 family peptidase [Desulfuromonadaceae bacterium]
MPRHSRYFPFLLIIFTLLTITCLVVPAHAVTPQLAAGYNYSVVLKDDGTVWTWGNNDNGQLGDGTTTSRTIPAKISSLANIKAVSATVALKDDGTVWRWGNILGHISQPTLVNYINNVISISSGPNNTFALKNDGTIWMWGSFPTNGSQAYYYTPVQVASGLADVIAIAAGSNHVLALRSDGTVWSWGSNQYGKLGNGNTIDSDIPVQVVGLSGVTSIAAANTHSVALKNDGSVWTWGQLYVGQYLTEVTTPVQTVGLSEVTAISANMWHTIALKGDGTVWGWGINLGVKDKPASPIPIQVIGMTGATAIASGYNHTLALKTDGSVWAWGQNDYGELGDGTTSTITVPLQVIGISGVISIKAAYQTAALKSDGTVWSWGYNFIYSTASIIPVQATTISGVSSIAASDYFTIYMKEDGTVWGWGDNGKGQLGDGTFISKNSIVQVLSLSNITSISAGSLHAVALKNDGTVWSWGGNSTGQLGDGTVSIDYGGKSSPVQVSGLTGVIAVAAGSAHTVALKSDGTVWTWGYNGYGQLGNGTTVNSSTPVQVSGLTEITAIAAGSGNTIALKNDGTVWTWGDNYYGQLGNGTAIQTGGQSGVSTPQQVVGLGEVVAITTGMRHSVVLKNDGTVWAWGYNVNGFLGDGTTIPYRTTPVQVLGLGGVTAISAGDLYSAVVKNNDTVWIWGHNNGFLGIDDPLYHLPRQSLLQMGSSIDLYPPFISVFTFSPYSKSLTGQVSLLTALDAVGVAGYCLKESATKPDPADACWQSSLPDGYAFDTPGYKTIYAFARDAAGNISSGKPATVLVDNNRPSVLITTPLDNSSHSSLLQITGSSSDATSSIVKVEVMISDGTFYVHGDGSQDLEPTWIVATGKNSWALNTSLVNWTEGSTYSILARSYDQVGNISSLATSSFTYVTAVGYTTLSMDLSAQTVLQGGKLSASGKLTRLPDNGTDLSNLTIALSITTPDGSLIIPAPSAVTTDSTGHFSFTDMNIFVLKGTYTIKAVFTGTATLAHATSTTNNLLVGASAGYAIIIEGKIPSDEGLLSHNKTANRIFKTLKKRGFIDDNITYFNYDLNQDVLGITVDDIPGRAGILYAIETWARIRMNSSPAPLYIIMVDHGSRENFHIDNEVITPDDLNTWLTNMEKNLNTSARSEKRIIINGSCYSGSFISTLSKSGRIIITSADTNEESYRGPMEPDTVRSGEYFLDSLFQELGKGRSLTASFDESVKKTRLLTKEGENVTNGHGYGDGAVQHPLLDDTGKGKGSNSTSIIDGNGKISNSIFLGTGDTVTNAANPEDITSVTPTQIIAVDTNQFNLGLTTLSSNSLTSSAWAEIRIPTVTLSPSGTSSSQLILDYPRILLSPDSSDPTGRRWIGNANLGNIFPSGGVDEIPSGKYEIFYYARNAVTGDVAPMQRGSVYKQLSKNTAPSIVSLATPLNGSEQKTMLIFAWTEAIDPEGDRFSYTLEIATDDIFSNIVYNQENILVTASYVAYGKLNDLTTFYWRIKSIDQYGAVSISSPFSFHTDNTNGIVDSIVTGTILNNSGAPLSSATLQIGTESEKNLFSGGTGMFLFSTPTSVGTTETSVTIKASGFKSRTIPISLTGGSVLNTAIYLEPAIPRTVTVSITGTGTGTVNSVPVGIFCEGTGAGCRSTFNEDTIITLTAFPSSSSILSTWGGACSGKSLSCEFTLNTDTNVTATIIYMPPVKQPGTVAAYFDTITAAYASCPNGGTVTFQAMANVFNENITLYRNINVTLQGGFDGAFASTGSGNTVIQGVLTVKQGRLSVRNVVVR